MRRLEKIRHEGSGNSLSKWYRHRNPLKVILNFLVISIAKIIPSLSVKNWLYRRLGIKIGRGVSIGLGVQFDIFFPELIEIGENSIVGYGSTILTHEFLIRELRKGKVKIGKNVLIGANTTILPGVEICDSATVSACSLVNRDIGKGKKVGGVPARAIK